ncbi:MAG: porin [Sphingomicrobium sp.]
MKLAYLILASTAVAASPALAQTAPAPAATITPEQIQALQAQIQALQAQVNQLQTAQSATEAKVAAVPAAAPKSDSSSWTKDTKITGKAYFNISSIDNERDGVNQASNGTQTELKRFYLGVDHRFNDVLSANLTTDFRYGSNGTSNDVLVYVKKAYLQAKFAPEFFVRVGSADLPWVPFAEGIYGYRFVENTLIDRTKFGTSADWGVHVGGSLLDGKISYAASAINGAGYKTLSRSSNTIDLEGRISANPIKNVTLAVGGYSGKLGKSADGGADTRRATRFNALAAYTDSRVRLGVEYFHAKNWLNVTGPVGDSADGWSAFGSFAFTKQFSVFGRYDWVKPKKDASPDLRDRYFNVGVNYKPVKELDLALVYKGDRAKNGFLSTSNGTIGGFDNLTSGSYDEVGLFGQFAF